MKQKGNTALYIIISFISPIFLAWVLSQTSWGTNPNATANKGILINKSTPWQVISVKKDDPKIWRIMVFPADNSQCEKLIEHVDASVVLQRENADRVKLILPNTCSDEGAQSKHESADLTEIKKQTSQHFVTDNAAIEYMIVDPLGYAVMAYTATSTDKALVKDLKTLLKYSKVG